MTKQVAVDSFFNDLDPKFFKIFAEPVRLDILRFLLMNGSSDIKGIASVLPQDRSVISRHLQLMEEKKIVQSQKDGRHLIYHVNAEYFLSVLQGIASSADCCVKACC